MNKLFFTQRENWKEEVIKAKEKKGVSVFNFMNSHDLYIFSRSHFFRETLDQNSVIIPDGFIVSLFLSISSLKRIRRMSGTGFMKSFFGKKELTSGKHLFLGSGEKDVLVLIQKFPYLEKKNLLFYNPPKIDGYFFDEGEIRKIANLIKNEKIDFVWVGLGCPKQNFLAYTLTKEIGWKKVIFFNVGAAMDFVLGKKKKAPTFFLKTGTEWLYRLVTDFSHSKKKVWRSFASLPNLNKIQVKEK